MSFFDPNLHSSQLFAIGSAGHLALIAILFALLGLLLLFRGELPRLRASRAFMAGTAAFVLSLELFSYALKFIYPCDPAFERIPLHLCASLKLAITICILLERYELAKYVSIWAVGCGFISFVNLNLGGESFGNFMFWHYLIGHYYLFLAPLFLFLTGDFRYDLAFQKRSSVALLAWSGFVFFLNWALDTNWMYTGPHNTTRVPLVPERFMAWPGNYVSYIAIAFVLLNGVYLILRACQARLDGTPGATPLPAAVTVTAE